MDLAEADATKANLVAAEEAHASGKISRLDLDEAHRRYTEAEIWRSDQEAERRRADMKAQGIVPGPNQGIGLGS